MLVLVVAAAAAAGERAADPVPVVMPYFANGHWGLLDSQGHVAVPASYDSVPGISSDGVARLLAGARASPEFIVRETLFEAAEMQPAFKAQVVQVCRGKRCGAVGIDGRERVPLVYDEVIPGDSGVIAVRRGGHWGVANEDGREVVAPKFLSLPYFSAGRALVQVDDRHSQLIATDGRALAAPVRLTPYGGPLGHFPGLHFVNAIQQAQDGEAVGLIDGEGRWLVPPQFESIRVGSHYHLAERKGLWGVIDAQGHWIIEPRDPNIGVLVEASDGPLYIEKSKGRSRAIGPSGHERWSVDGAVDRATCGGLELWTNGPILSRRRGVIDFEGRTVVPPRYYVIGQVAEGRCVATYADGKAADYLDTTGRVVLSGVGGGDFSEGLAVHIGADFKKGYIDTEGRLVIPARYERAGNFENGVAGVILGENFAYIDRQGRILWEYPPGLSR